jgi:hypothetical protein
MCSIFSLSTLKPWFLALLRSILDDQAGEDFSRTGSTSAQERVAAIGR